MAPAERERMDERRDIGRLEGISVPDLVWNVCRRRATGVLHLSARGTTKKIYVSEGRIIFAASSDPNDRLGEMLLREGIITLDQLEQAIVKLSSGKRLGTLLVEAGHEYHELTGVMMKARAELHRGIDVVAGVGEELFNRYQGGEAGSIDEAGRAALKSQAAKRVAIQFHLEETVTWDHSKLGGAY